MATDSQVSDAIFDRTLSDPDDLITSQSRLSFSSSSLGHKDDTEFWSKTRKEMIQPAHSAPERTSSAPNVMIPKEELMSEEDEADEAAIADLSEAVRVRQVWPSFQNSRLTFVCFLRF